VVVPLLFVALSAAGCADAGVGKTYPVSGKVTLNGQPLIAKSAIVHFKPNADRGNTTPHEPAAMIDANGNYTLYTKDRRGAPPGWYKVSVTAIEEGPPAAASQKPLTDRPLPKSLVPARYGVKKTTPLEVEVVATPAEGSYDLKLTD
jgi:hypothetical protein